MDELRALVASYDIGEIVVGMPLTLKGEKRQTAEEVEKFMNRLHEALNIPVVSIDERFTSQLAQETIRMMGVKKKTATGQEDRRYDCRGDNSLSSIWIVMFIE